MMNIEKIQDELSKNIPAIGAPVISFDQKFYRFDIDKKGDKAGWTIGSSWTYDGKDYACLNYGNWKSGEKFLTNSWDKELEISDVKFREKMKKNQAKQEAIIELQRKKENLDAAEKARAEIEKLKPASASNWYLEKKKINLCSGLYQTIELDLVIPMFDAPRNIVGRQVITQKGKFFLRGQRVDGAWFCVGNPDDSNFIYVAEGYATAQTIHDVTGKPCLVTFNCHNLLHAIESFSEHYTAKKYIICADNDKNRIGEKMAKKAARNKSNVRYIVPKFETKTTTLTDFNDLFVTRGFEETKKQLEQIKPDDFVSIELLGHRDGKHYFYSSRSHEIHSFSFSSIKDGSLAELINEEYWKTNYYEKFDKHGNPLNICDWKRTAEKISENQHSIGRFSITNVRGFGSWRDSGKIVINTGHKLLVNNEERSFSDRQGLKYFYYPSKKVDLDFTSNISPDFTPISNALELVDFERDNMRLFLAGFLVHACSFSSDRWKTHIWLSAPHGSGKSTLLEFIQGMIVNAKLVQDTSAAGIRNFAGHDSMVILADENEAEERYSKQLVSLAKQASSGADSAVLRGTTNNSGSIEYNPSLLFCFASIRKSDLSKAENSRIIDIKLKKTVKFDIERNNQRKKLMKEASKLSKNLFIHVNRNLEKIEALKSQAKEILAENNFDARSCDTYSNFLAGYSFISGNTIEYSVQRMIDSETQDEVQENIENGDHESFIDALSKIIIRDGADEVSLDDTIFAASENEEYSFLLKKYDIYVRSGMVHFKKHNRNLMGLFKKQTEFKDPYFQMQSDKETFKQCVIKLNGRSRRVISCNLSVFS